MPSTAAFLRQYLRPVPGAVARTEAVCHRGDEVLPATLFRPAGARGKLPGWVVLHGLTYHGREHPSLIRFAEAMAAAGAVVCVPDIPEWKVLRVAPAVTAPSIHAGIATLRQQPDVTADRLGVVGFSFGATQALVAATDPEVSRELRGVAAWGGYADIHRLFQFGITGEYEWDGERHVAEPDPYGRWVMGGNYLTAIPGHEGDADLATGLHQLAMAAGHAGVYAADASYDPLKLEIRARLTPAQQDTFDLFAPRTGEPVHDMPRARALASKLSEAAVGVDPLLDATPHLPRVRARVFVAHGRDDRLVPYTEAYRMAKALPAGTLQSVVVTSLFAHSGGTQSGLGPVGLAREGARFVRLLSGILRLV